MAPFETSKRFQTREERLRELRERNTERELFGVRIWNFDPEGPLGKTGFRLGDVIVKINGEPIPSDEEEILDFFETHIHERKGPVSITVRDGGTTIDRWVQPVWDPAARGFFLRFDWTPCQLRVRKKGTIEETWTERQKHVYYDEEGQAYAFVDVELDAELEELETEEVLGQRILKCRVAANEGDTMIDLLPYINPEKIPLYLDFAGLENLALETGILIADASSPQMIGTIIHEVRHIRQRKDPFFKALLDYYGAESDTYLRKERPFKTIAVIAGLFPRHKEALLSVMHAIRREDERSHTAWTQDRQRFCREMEQKTGKTRGSFSSFLENAERVFNEFSLQPFPSVEEEELRGERELAIRDELANHLALRAPSRKTEILASWDRYVFSQHAIEKRLRAEGVMDVLRWPRRVIERDAEAANLMGLRTIRREFGIDLLKSYAVTPAEETERCLDDWRANSPQETLKTKIQNMVEEEFSRARDESMVEQREGMDSRGRVIASMGASVQHYMRKIGASPRNMRVPRYERETGAQALGTMISQSDALRKKASE
jgi:hypothetical protein